MIWYVWLRNQHIAHNFRLVSTGSADIRLEASVSQGTWWMNLQWIHFCDDFYAPISKCSRLASLEVPVSNANELHSGIVVAGDNRSMDSQYKILLWVQQQMCHPQLPSWLYHFLVSAFYGCCMLLLLLLQRCIKDVILWCWCILMHFLSDFIWLCWISMDILTPIESFWCRGTNPSSASRSSPSSETSLSSQDSSPVHSGNEVQYLETADLPVLHSEGCWKQLKTIMVSVGSYVMKWLGIRPWPYDLVWQHVTTIVARSDGVRRSSADVPPASWQGNRSLDWDNLRLKSCGKSENMWESSLVKLSNVLKLERSCFPNRDTLPAPPSRRCGEPSDPWSDSSCSSGHDAVGHLDALRSQKKDLSAQHWRFFRTIRHILQVEN